MKAPVFVLSALFAIGTASPAHAQLGGLGKLKKATGGETFELPKGKDLSGYTTLLVWSKKDKRAVASAEWHPTSGKMTDHM